MGGFNVDQVIIRPATPDDGEAIARLWEKLVTYHTQLDSDLPRPIEHGGQIYVHRFIDRVDDPNGRAYVAIADGQIIGYVLGAVIDLVPEMFVQEMCGFLADIYVEEAYRSQGIGHGLVQALADWFRSRGVDYFEWYVAAENQSGRAFWRSIGGREVMVRMRAHLKGE